MSDASVLPAVPLVIEALDRIDALNPQLNAFITVMREEALAQARQLDDDVRQGKPRGPLHGMPISVKDLIDVAGVPTTAASRVRAGHVAREDAPLVARLRKAGAIIIGKCNLHEFALGTTSDESAFGPARNPFDARRSPGGSSGGSAAAVAACMGRASIGSDTGGSIRIPAAACGVVGLKPTLREISTEGVVPLSASLDHVGPIARTVSDVSLLYDVLVGREPSPLPSVALPQIRLGKLGGYFLDPLDNEVRARFEEALNRLHGAGVTMTKWTVSLAHDIPSTYVNIVLPEAYAYHAKTVASMPDAYCEGVGARLAMGREISAADYERAQGVRAALRAEVDATLERCDALVLPTLPMPAPLLGATTVRMGGHDEQIRPMMLKLTQLFNLTGHPAISLPCGDTRDGLPCGFQLVGRREQTRELLALALACEPLVTPHPPRCAGDS